MPALSPWELSDLYEQAAIGTYKRGEKNSSMRIKLSPSAVQSDAALASLLCAGKFKVGYFLDSLRNPISTQIPNQFLFYN
jgi:hypothetical protein